MDVFGVPQMGRVFAIRLDKGDDLLECLQSFINKNVVRDAAVVSGIGTLSDCVLHMVTTTGLPAIEHFEKWEDKPLEIASIDGIIADGQPHLHMVVSDTHAAYAGHVEPGCRVLYLAELVIIELLGGNLTRKLDQDKLNKLTGIK